VVSNFIVQALLGKPITIYGDGSQTRSFCFVSDLVDGMIRMMDSPDDCIGPINMGNPVEITIGQLAREIVDLTGSKSDIVFKPLPSDDPTRRCPDISLAKKHLNWEPQKDRISGLKETIEYFRGQLA
jgi:UDP-glucuronate decarboxylase